MDLWVLKLLMTDLQRWKKILDDLVKSFYFTGEGTGRQRGEETVSAHVTGCFQTRLQAPQVSSFLPSFFQIYQWVIWQHQTSFRTIRIFFSLKTYFWINFRKIILFFTLSFIQYIKWKCFYLLHIFILHGNFMQICIICHAIELALTPGNTTNEWRPRCPVLKNPAQLL